MNSLAKWIMGGLMALVLLAIVAIIAAIAVPYSSEVRTRSHGSDVYVYPAQPPSHPTAPAPPTAPDGTLALQPPQLHARMTLVVWPLLFAGIVVLGLIWLLVAVMRGNPRAQAAAGKERAMLERLVGGLDKMETRMDNLETIFDARQEGRPS